MSSWSKIGLVAKRKIVRRLFIFVLLAAATSMALRTLPFPWREPAGKQKLGDYNRRQKLETAESPDLKQKSDAVTVSYPDIDDNVAKEEMATTMEAEEHFAVDKTEKPILIFDWTGFFGNPIDTRYNLADCPNLNCKLVNNRSSLDESRAVVFHARDINWSYVPEIRHASQYYVFFSLESPSYATIKFDECRKDMFNLTMTYRHDSDIPMPYGYFRRRKERDESMNLSAIIRQKSKMAAWFASNCKTASGREHYVKALKRAGVSVDVYGACADDHRFTCPQWLQPGCDRLLSDHYKFYLSFENSLCNDYVTEKFYDRVKNFVVPIVMERRNYDNIDIIPPRSFIAVDSYPSMEHLARHLAYLDAHDDEYQKYLEWHRDYEVVPCLRREGGCGFCNLCRYLLRMLNRKVRKPKILDIRHWWHETSGCGRAPAAVMQKYEGDDANGGLMEIAFAFTAVGFMFAGVLFVAIVAAFHCLND